MSRPQGIVVIGVSLGAESRQVAAAGIAVSRELRRRPELVHAYTPVRHLLRAGGEPSDLHHWGRAHEELQHKLHDLAGDLGADARQVGWHVEDGRPFEVLNDVASSLDADLIVVGAGGPPATSRGGLGSTADRLLRTATRAVLVLRGELVVPPRRVLVTLDLSRSSAEAYRGGQLLLDQMTAGGATIDSEMLMVLDPSEVQRPLSDEELERFVHHELAHIAETYGKRDPATVRTRVERGDPRDRIIATLESASFDLLVMGTHGRSGLQRLLLGSVATDLLRRSPCSVLIVPPAAGLQAAATLHAPAVEALAHRPDFTED
jgi:nucleotide-binding universal stress UspA family protein